LPNFEKEVLRNKNTWKTRLRRLIGIPNVRIRFDRQGDLFFTYGTLIITHKPYCTYIETGLALYNYDLGIAKNPLARWIVILLATRQSCKKLIFLSEAARKSFYTTVSYPNSVQKLLKAKSAVIYPIPIAKQNAMPKKSTTKLRLLFPGTFYMKGGLELAHAYARLRKKYSNLSLTIITATHVIRQQDIDYLRALPDLDLKDATLNEQEMIEVYRSHDVFLLPTYREGFGLVLIEALAYGMPVIITDQYATSEMAIDGYNGFIYPDHPLKDYDPKSYRIYGRYSNPKDFYAKLFLLQKGGKLKPVEDFIVKSVRRFLDDPGLLEKFSKHSLALYKKKFDADKLSIQIEEVFLKSIEKQR
jgi:glycosyltransferase involved in cell wall biosynthesis